MLHSFGIYEEFECRSRLTLSSHLIIFPMIEIDVTYPRLHMSGLRLHGYEGTVHESHHIANRVHGGHFHLNLSLFVIEELYLMRLVQIIRYGVWLIRVLRLQLLVNALLLCNILDKTSYLLMLLILPWILISPMVSEISLHLTHLFDSSLLCIFLHSGIKGGIDFQSRSIEIIASFLTP